MTHKAEIHLETESADNQSPPRVRGSSRFLSILALVLIGLMSAQAALPFLGAVQGSMFEPLSLTRLPSFYVLSPMGLAGRFVAAGNGPVLGLIPGIADRPGWEGTFVPNQAPIAFVWWIAAVALASLARILLGAPRPRIGGLTLIAVFVPAYLAACSFAKGQVSTELFTTFRVLGTGSLASLLLYVATCKALDLKPEEGGLLGQATNDTEEGTVGSNSGA